MGNKFKRKLLRAKKSKSLSDLDPSTVLMTITDEIFQPARIFYDVYELEALENIFLDLQCMAYDDQKNRWVWNYADEAKNIQFKRSWSDLPPNVHPLVIGSLHAPIESVMYVDVNSFERVPAAVNFFGDQIDRTIAEVTHVQFYNKISRVRDGMPDHHKLFEKILSHRPDPDAEIHALISEAKESGTLERLREQVLRGEHSKNKMESIETMKVYYDIGHEADCLDTLQASLRMRTAVALEHDRGNKDYTFQDFFNIAFNLNG